MREANVGHDSAGPRPGQGSRQDIKSPWENRHPRPPRGPVLGLPQRPSKSSLRPPGVAHTHQGRRGRRPRRLTTPAEVLPSIPSPGCTCGQCCPLGWSGGGDPGLSPSPTSPGQLQGWLLPHPGRWQLQLPRPQPRSEGLLPCVPSKSPRTPGGSRTCVQRAGPEQWTRPAEASLELGAGEGGGKGLLWIPKPPRAWLAGGGRREASAGAPDPQEPTREPSDPPGSKSCSPLTSVLQTDGQTDGGGGRGDGEEVGGRLAGGAGLGAHPRLQLLPFLEADVRGPGARRWRAEPRDSRGETPALHASPPLSQADTGDRGRRGLPLTQGDQGLGSGSSWFSTPILQGGPLSSPSCDPGVPPTSGPGGVAG